MANYYVAPIPSHGAGTLANPWGIPDLLTGPGGAVGPPTRGVALNTPVAGDTLYWRGGNYHFTGSSINGDNTRQLLAPSNSGTATQPITFRAYQGETVHIFEDTGTQPVMGTELPTVNYVRFLGLTVHMTPNDFHGPGFRISGTGNEIGWCEVVGTYVPTSDNHDAIRLDYSTNSWIHHNNLHGVQGDHHNSVGIKMYHNVTPLIEDNYIHGCFAAIYDKNGDSGTGNYKEQSTYRRNWFTNCSYPVFVGNDDGAGNTANYFLYDNVFDANTNNTLAAIRLNDIQSAPSGQCQVYNNLFRNVVAGQAVMSAYGTNQQSAWNNIVLSSGTAVMGYYEYYTVFTPSGPSAPLTYMDYNVYEVAPSSYKFGQFSTPSSFTFAQFQAQGFETHAYRDPAANIFVDQTSYVLKGIYPTAGRYGDMVGPRYPIASIINPARYGPAAMPGLATPGYISETGLLGIFCLNAGDLTNPITAISANPSFFLNGSGTPMAVTGPFWRDTRKDSCLVTYRPNTDLLVTDSVTMTTTAGWATTVAGAMPAVTLQSLQNKLGQSEPSMGSFGGVAYPGFDQPSSQWTMPLGINITHGGASLYFSSYYPFSNALHRGKVGDYPGIATTDANGNPLTISAKVSIGALFGQNSGFADARSEPQPMGVYRFIADESAPATPMVVTLTGTANITISAPTITGTGAGKMWAWTVAYSPANPTSFFANLTLNIDKPVGGSFPCAWTLGTNFRLQMPGNPTRPVSNLAIDETVRSWLTTPSNKTPAYVRWVDTVIGSDGISTQVDPGDLLNPLTPFWNPDDTTVAITAIRNFDPAVSPYTYWSQHWPNATTPGGGPPGAPYALPTNAGMLNFTGVNTSWIMVECEFDNSAYQLKSYQTISISGLPTSLACTNGSLANVNVNLNGAFPTIFVTAPGRFVFAWSPAGTHPTNTTGMPGNINTLAGRTVCAGTATLSVPDGGSTGYAGSAYVTGQLGSGYHMNIPAGATDAFVTAAAAQVFANYPSGGRVLVEYSNELWSFIGSMLGQFLLGSCHALSATYTSRAQTAVLRARQVHDLVAAAAVTAGWTGTIVRAFGSQYGNPGGETTPLINFVNTYNTSNPGSPIQVDAVMPAPYMPAPMISDVTLNAACASVYAQDASSTQFGNANPFTRAQWWDLFAHQIKYYTADNGPAGRAASTLAILKTYRPVNSQGAGFVPAMIGYEGGLQNVYTNNTSSSTAMNLKLMHDLQYDPMARKFDLANYQSWQFAGFSHVNIYGLCLLRQPPNVWGVYSWAGQQPGPGDGTVDGVTNQFFVDTGQAQDYTNQSVRGYMQRQWMDVANTTTTAPATPAGAITLHSLTAAGTGTFVGSSVGSGAITLRALTRAGTGTFANSSIGSGSIVLRSLVTAGAGTFTPTATFGEVTLGSLTVAGVGAVSVAGVITLGSLTVAGSGTIASSTTGAVTLDGLTPDGTGEFTTEMDSTVTLGQLAVSGVGTVSPHRLPAAVRWFPNLSRT